MIYQLAQAPTPPPPLSSTMNMQDTNKEESYSMYPKTSSPPPPTPTNMQIPIYQAPMQMYGYTQAPYLYPTQMPAYSLNMVTQNQAMYHQNTSPHYLPPQNNINTGSTNGSNSINKKKWHSNGPANNSNGQSANSNGSGVNYNKSHNYHHNYSNSHIPMMNTANNGNNMPVKKQANSSVANGSTPSPSYNSSSQYDLFKFDVTKLKNFKENSSNSIQLPLFINTTESEFAAASAQRYDLNLKSLNLESKSAEDQANTTTHHHRESHTLPKDGEKLEAEVEAEEVDKEGKDVDDKKPSASKDNREHKRKIEPKKDDTEKEQGEGAISETYPASEGLPVVGNEELEETADEDTTKASSSPTLPTAKSWSAIASDAIKSRQASNKSASGSTISQTSASTTATSAPLSTAATAKSNSPLSSKQPQRKDKKYVPPSTKGIEPLGSIALRMCFDPDFISYVLQNKDTENKIPLHSIIPRGIINRANICFMSSVLQVLLYCQPFIDVLNVLSTRNTNSRIGTSSCRLLDACLTMYKQFDVETYEKSLESANENEKSTETDTKKPTKSKNFQHNATAEAVKPDDFYKTLSTIPKFKDLQWGHQEDAEEFLTHLLDQLHEELIFAIDGLSDNEIQNMLQSINDEQLKIFFIRNLSRYGKAEFIKNASPRLKELIEKYGMISDDSTEENGWHEVSGSSKRGKKTKTAAKRTVEIVPSPISKLFGGQFRSVLDIPNNKESQSITLDPFQTIQLDISDSSVNDLETAFKKFSEYELLPFKSSSGNDVEAKKQTFIDKLPQVLLIQFKRFSFINNVDKDNAMTNYNAYNGRIEKIRKKIKYGHELIIPEESMSSITLKNHATGIADRNYKLTGVIYHHGISSDGGHYTADVYHSEHNKWYRIDDVNIIELEDDDVLKGGEEASDSRTAYILMYQKKN